MIITVPGWMIAIFTFPGTIAHEVAHRFFCDLFGVPVYEVRYFIFMSHTSGYVRHGDIEKTWQSLIVSIAPLFVNTLLCALFTFPLASVIYFDFKYDINLRVHPIIGILYLFLFWVGISIGSDAFPSNQDMKCVLDIAERNNELSFTHFIVTFLAKIVVFLNFLSQFWVSFIYAGAVALVLPALVFG